MRKKWMLYRTLVFVFILTVSHVYGQVLRLDEDNPHYLNYKGDPIILITSAEHYGAVLNLDFDYNKYLATLHAEDMNYTRIFMGNYVEADQSHGISANTLGPAPGRFVTPWKRTDIPGGYTGDFKWDLDEWNPAYFDRLKDFIAKAESLDIIVELTFFCATYNDEIWERHAFNPQNVVNEIGELSRGETNTLANPTLVSYQKKLIEKVVQEVNTFPNIFYEISNEPWVDNPRKDMYLHKTIRHGSIADNWTIWAVAADEHTMAWQKEMAAAIVEAQSGLRNKHLIAQNYTNSKSALTEIDPNISIINFHYAWPESVYLNYGWNKPINFDESGFYGQSDSSYLDQAWRFILAGGAVFNNLDYSFYVGHEAGDGKNDAPGGGSVRLRKQLSTLKSFMNDFDYIHMRPDFDVVFHAPGMIAHALSDREREYAIYLSGKNVGQLSLRLAPGRYGCTMIDADTGQTVLDRTIVVDTEIHGMEIPKGPSRVGLQIRRL